MWRISVSRHLFSSLKSIKGRRKMIGVLLIFFDTAYDPREISCFAVNDFGSRPSDINRFPRLKPGFLRSLHLAKLTKRYHVASSL